MDSNRISPPLGTRPGGINKGPRACATCARAKSRCISGPRGQEKCERCHRLQKPCSSQTPAPARKRKDPKPTRVAELERRLEDLTARIESVQRQGPVALSPPDSDHYVLPSSLEPPAVAPEPSSLPPPGTFCKGSVRTTEQGRWTGPYAHLFPGQSLFGEGQPASTSNGNNNNSTTAPTSLISPSSPYPTQPDYQPTSSSSHPALQPPPPQPFPTSASADDPWPTGDEAESHLTMYHERFAHLFPFIIVPTHLTAAQMRVQRPFLWKAIMIETSLFNGARQIQLGDALLREMGEVSFMGANGGGMGGRKGEGLLDLLQGVQMLIDWYHYNLNNFQMVNLLFLAQSVTASLGTVEPNEEGDYDTEALEQMRAFATTYYLVTLTFTTNKRPDSLMNNINLSYLTTCCHVLLTRMEHPTDELVVHLVRAQRLLQSISQGFARRKAMLKESRVPQTAFVAALKERVRGFAAALPAHVKGNVSLEGHFLVAEILIYENSLEELSHCPMRCFQPQSPQQPRQQDPNTNRLNRLNPSSPATSLSPPSTDEQNANRVQMLWDCARVVEAFMSRRFAHETGDFPRFISLTSLDLTYVFLTMLKLATLQVPGWELEEVRRELRLYERMDQLIRRMEHSANKRKRATQRRDWPIDEREEAEDPFAKLARKVANVRDIISATAYDSGFATSQVARVVDPAPMTLADATQDLMQDLGGGGLWQPDAAGAGGAGGLNLNNCSGFGDMLPEWDSLEGVDWAAVFSGDAVCEGFYAS
ncbi:uncharacterized protein C8A04DRAFT_9434 [Dichotomopilus funicola]|uniref:Zn(2)-C6 fungal-type domain-containing protein n=1 Tax=Dichotomopilus funicola TaxID=1934379 RepID=A0AAN6V9V0_9PEZI|nr:hypothetical protein C8A04DRAFT_9434 [Dichotomopilus funicola]